MTIEDRRNALAEEKERRYKADPNFAANVDLTGLEGIKVELAEANAKIISLTGDNAQAVASLATLTKQHAGVVAEFDAYKADFTRKVNDAVTTTLAGGGHMALSIGGGVTGAVISAESRGAANSERR